MIDLDVLSTIPSALALFFLIFWVGLWGLHLIAIIYGKLHLHKRIEKLAPETPLPGVSILKPLAGTDSNLFSNLETFFVMDYPIYELLFCVEDEHDDAIMLVNRLIEKYPHIDAQLFIGAEEVGVNPKINNMHSGYVMAKHDLILISDSGIKMREDTLLDMVHHLKDDVGLVHQMPFTCDREGFAATLEKVYFGTAQARIYLCAAVLGINCHTGMSTLIRKSLLEECGGLRVFGCYLAEDFFIAQAIKDKGWQVKISSLPALQNSGICQVASFQARLARWVKLRWAMIPLMTVLEPLTECVILGACAGWASSYVWNWDPLVFFLVHILVWFLLDFTLLRVVQNGSLPFSKFDFVLGWLFREWTGPLLFVRALMEPQIQWRTRWYKLRWGGLAEVYTKIKVRL